MWQITYIDLSRAKTHISPPEARKGQYSSTQLKVALYHTQEMFKFLNKPITLIYVLKFKWLVLLFQWKGMHVCIYVCMYGRGCLSSPHHSPFSPSPVFSLLPPFLPRPPPPTSLSSLPFFSLLPPLSFLSRLFPSSSHFSHLPLSPLSLPPPPFMYVWSGMQVAGERGGRREKGGGRWEKGWWSREKKGRWQKGEGEGRKGGRSETPATPPPPTHTHIPQYMFEKAFHQSS